MGMYQIELVGKGGAFCYWVSNKSLMSETEKVQEVLDKLRPFIQRDGGDVELVDVEDGIVSVRLLGACGSCPSSTITLKAGIERALMEEVPEVREVIQVL